MRRRAFDLHPKVAAGLLASYASTLIVYTLHVYGIDLPAEVDVSLVGLLTFAASWLVPDDVTVPEPVVPDPPPVPVVSPGPPPIS